MRSVGRLVVEVGEAGHQAQVLLAGEQTVHGGELSGDSDGGPDLIRLRDDIEPRDADRPGVRCEQGREDVDRDRLAGAVGSEQREDDAGRDVEIHPAQDVVVLERSMKTFDLNCGLCVSIH